MIAQAKAIAKRHWPHLRLRTILLSTLILVAALPGFGALFLRVYENVLVRQTEAELIAQGAALSAAAAIAWPGYIPPSAGPTPPDDYQPEPPAIDLRSSAILPDRPPPTVAEGRPDALTRAVAARLVPAFTETSHTTLASIQMLDRSGLIVSGSDIGRSYAALPEVERALHGEPATTLRRNQGYHRTFPVEWLSRSANLRIHHARPIIVQGRVVGALLLARSPPPLYMGLYRDAGKIAIGILAILLFVIVLSGLLSRAIVRPIQRLGLATREVARGGAGAVPEMPEMAAVEIQALYADFAQMAAAIERRSRYLRDFAHAVSHEFKTPLAGIRGAVELLQDHHDIMSAEERRRFLANAAIDADRLALLVTRLLELARADMTRVDGEASDLALALRRIADAYDGPAFAIRLNLPPRLPHVAVPPSTIEAVIDNLIENSRQAGAGHCAITASWIDDEARILVADDGPGIAAADRDRLFEPFFTTRRTAGGTGLGLSIARSLLDACGGQIRLVDSAAGCVIEITVPAAQR
jgi:signal transduction histidine kinase